MKRRCERPWRCRAKSMSYMSRRRQAERFCAPIVDYLKQLGSENPERRILTVIPELVQRHWSQWLLHTQRAEILKGRLLMEGHDRISVLNIPWYEKSDGPSTRTSRLAAK